MNAAPTLLKIDASCRGGRSLTRLLSGRFAEEWKKQLPHAKIIERDVGRNPPPFISEEWLEAAFTDAPSRTEAMRRTLAYSDACLREMREASVYVLAAPMYNYGMPASLKAWVDQVIRLDETFTFDLARGDFPLEPVLRDKRLVVLSARGEFGFGKNEVRGNMNHLDPHIETLEPYLGVKRSWTVKIEYQEFDDARFAASKETALASISSVVAEVIADLSA